MKGVILSACICLLPIMANSQQSSPRLVPQQALTKFSPLLGAWESETKWSPDGGKTWQKMAAKKVNVAFEMNNLLLSQRPVGKPSGLFSMLTHISYDQYRGMYRKMAIDDNWGLMDIYEGHFADESHFVIDNVKYQTYFPTKEGKWQAFKLSIEIDQCQRMTNIDKSLDNGKTWEPAFIVEYSRPASFEAC